MKPLLSTAVLVDRRNLHSVLPRIRQAVEAAELVGLDCETHDANRHAGLKKFCHEKENGSTSRTVFDMRRTTMTGFSVWPEGHGEVYYVNLAHADAENRVPFDEVRPILDAAKVFVAHNASFEINAFRNCHGYVIDDRVLCSLQLCVSAYGPDEYHGKEFNALRYDRFMDVSENIRVPAVMYALTGKLSVVTDDPSYTDIAGIIASKTSDAKRSYNGVVREMAYGYGLKKAVKSWFGVDLLAYKDLLKNAVVGHMGQLRGDEVVKYGCDDAYWAVCLFREVSAYIASNPPLERVLETYFGQELPMVPVYARLWREGMRVDPGAVRRRILEERVAIAACLRGLRGAIRRLLPFPAEPNPKLAEADAWYAGNAAKYRKQIETWASLPDADDLAELMAARGPTSNAAAEEAGLPSPTGPNFTHYMPIRTLLYDLIGADIILSEGRKTASNGEARGKIKEKHPKAAELVDRLNELASIEQRIKLFLTPYEQLIDPETGRLYPVVNSQLATRRMASQNPNPMQLAKRGASTYVRGFFKGDADDHVVLSIDWSGIELVLIGELSGDPAFLQAYGQLPHADLHSRATAAILSFELERDITEVDVKALPRMSEEQALDVFGPKVLVDTKGRKMSPGEAYKFHRGTDGGKGANFNYWYSGALGTLAERRGWTTEQMWAATELYRSTFPVAEAWRRDTTDLVCAQGYVTLPDGHLRFRYEATDSWMRAWEEIWSLCNWEYYDPMFPEVRRFIVAIGRKIQTRAKNQAVNAMIQGTCATLAKRSILRVLKRFDELGWGPAAARFMIPIHDELVFSVRHDLVVDAIREIKGIMCSHPDLFKLCKLDASPSVGLTFEPYDPTKAPYGQVELYEAPKPFGDGNRLDDDGVRAVVEYLMEGWRRGLA